MDDWSDKDILAEIDRIRFLYGLKDEIRYGLNRDQEEIASESVAEHLYGMQVIARYFLPLEDKAREWDWTRIYELMLWHDIDELETGDTIGYLKTDDERAGELSAAQRVIAQIPDSLQDAVSEALAEYAAQETIEAQFAKAIDRMEPNFHLFCENGKKINMNKSTTLEQHERIKGPYISKFPVMYRFHSIMAIEMEKQGFFSASDAIQ